MKNTRNKALNIGEKLKKVITGKHQGIDGLVVTVGLCIIALLLCVVMKDSLTSFIQTLVTALTNKAQTMLTL